MARLLRATTATVLAMVHRLVPIIAATEVKKPTTVQADTVRGMDASRDGPCRMDAASRTGDISHSSPLSFLMDGLLQHRQPFALLVRHRMGWGAHASPKTTRVHHACWGHSHRVAARGARAAAADASDRVAQQRDARYR